MKARTARADITGLYNLSALSADDASLLMRIENCIRGEQSLEAVNFAEAKINGRNSAKNLLLACAYQTLGKNEKVLNLLVPSLLKLSIESVSAQLTPKGIRTLWTYLSRAAEKLDPVLAEIIRTPSSICSGDIAASVVKSFYFSLTLDLKTLYHIACQTKADLASRLQTERNSGDLGCFIEFHKLYSSHTPLADRSGHSLGGGYFLAVGGFGCVIDPGHNFLRNFFERGRRIADIGAIVVTHDHDDHNADLPALLSLCRQQPRARKLQLYLDKHTYVAYKTLILASDYIQKPCHPMSALPCSWSLTSGRIRLTNKLILQPIPALHKLTRRDKSNSAVGLHFVVRNAGSSWHLIISGDTRWDPKIMSRIYQSFSRYRPILVPHVSTACEEEALAALGLKGGGYHNNHLCIRGTVEMIRACSPSGIILSEIGEELKDVIHELSKRITAAFGVPCFVGMKNDPYGKRVNLLSF